MDDAQLPADPTRQGGHGHELQEVQHRPDHRDHLRDGDEDQDGHDDGDAKAHPVSGWQPRRQRRSRAGMSLEDPADVAGDLINPVAAP